LSARASAAWLALALIVACDGEFRFDTSTADASAEAAPNGCMSDADCPLGSLHCDPPSGQCFACTSDAQCGSMSCDPSLRRCVECETTRDCPTGEACELTTRRCIPTCRESIDCVAPTLGCDELNHVCAECLINDDCRTSSNGTRCDRAIERCVECDADVQCPSTQPRCDRTRGKCTACLSDRDCTSDKPICDPSTWSCVAP
jgi:hypothetical protein